MILVDHFLRLTPVPVVLVDIGRLLFVAQFDVAQIDLPDLAIVQADLRADLLQLVLVSDVVSVLAVGLVIHFACTKAVAVLDSSVFKLSDLVKFFKS